MSRIWRIEPDLSLINGFSEQTLVSHLGINIFEIGDDYMKASMPVDTRTVQPMRLLHGGASVALAETLGSIASLFCIDSIEKKSVVGIEINANHLRAVKEGGRVVATVTPLRLGRTLHVWNINIADEQERLVCVSRLTMAVVERER